MYPPSYVGARLFKGRAENLFKKLLFYSAIIIYTSFFCNNVCKINHNIYLVIPNDLYYNIIYEKETNINSLQGGNIMAYVISSDCISCGACSGECPMGAISEGDGQYVIDAGTCIDCGACSDICPTGAISQG